MAIIAGPQCVNYMPIWRVYFNIICENGHSFESNMHNYKMKGTWCRKCYEENNKGANNSAAKSYKIISPDNEIFIIKGTLEKFCNENNLSHGIMQKILYKNYKNDNYKGWKIEYFNK